MKLIIPVFLISIINGFSQTYYYPVIESQNNKNIVLQKIVKTNYETIIHFLYTASDKYPNGGWICSDPNFHIYDNISDKKYKLISQENIPSCPEKHQFTKPNDLLAFRLIFQKIPKELNVFNIIEGYQESSWRFYNVDINDELYNEEGTKLSVISEIQAIREKNISNKIPITKEDEKEPGIQITLDYIEDFFYENFVKSKKKILAHNFVNQIILKDFNIKMDRYGIIEMETQEYDLNENKRYSQKTSFNIKNVSINESYGSIGFTSKIEGTCFNLIEEGCNCFIDFTNQYHKNKFIHNFIMINGAILNYEQSKKLLNAFKHLQELAFTESLPEPKSTDFFENQNFNNKTTGSNTEIVDLILKNGVKYLDIKICGKIFQGVLDSGASDLLINKNVVDYLIANGYSLNQMSGAKKQYQIADGTNINGIELILPKVSIGDISISNVSSSVIISDDSNYEILIGQSILSRFRSYKIDEQTKTLIITR